MWCCRLTIGQELCMGDTFANRKMEARAAAPSTRILWRREKICRARRMETRRESGSGADSTAESPPTWGWAQDPRLFPTWVAFLMWPQVVRSTEEVPGLRA